MSRGSDKVRLLTGGDQRVVERLLRMTDYAYQRFTFEELPMLLAHYPAAGLFRGTALSGFLLSQTVNPPSAWIGGFGVAWPENARALDLFETLLAYLTPPLVARGTQHLYYSGNDVQKDWLRDALLKRGFLLHRLLYAYDKFDYHIPTQGNQQVTIRPVRVDDIPTLLAIDEACFEPLWRYDAVSFADIASTHPYFVVAELHGKVVGYQFNALEDTSGYLVRIAVQPAVNSQGIGARLMAEAVRFFEGRRVTRIMLNTQDDNTHAHRLYEWFGFIRIQQTGFTLRKVL